MFIVAYEGTSESECFLKLVMIKHKTKWNNWFSDNCAIVTVAKYALVLLSVNLTGYWQKVEMWWATDGQSTFSDHYKCNPVWYCILAHPIMPRYNAEQM